MWSDTKFLELSRPAPNAQSLWLYLLSGPHTGIVPGLFVAGEAALAEALGWPVPALRRAMREITNLGMARVDNVTRLVFLPKAIVHNPPASPNVVRAWRTELEELPECALRSDAEAIIKAFLETFGEAFGKAFGQPSVKPKPYQEQEQEQDPPSPPSCVELTTNGSQGGEDKTPEPENSAEAWLDCLNHEAGRQFEPTPDNLKPIRARLKQGRTLAQAEAVVRFRVKTWANITRRD